MSSPKLQSAIGLPFPAALHDDGVRPAAIEARVLELFDECGPGLRRYVASFGLGAAATEDVVQEIFLALFRHLCLGRRETNLKGWTFRVGHNLALKQRQRAMKRLHAEGSWNPEVVEGVADPAAGPEQLLVDDRRHRRLASALQILPERDRQCVYLRAEGLGYRDIARTLGVSLGTVAKCLTRAMRRLEAAGLE